MAEGGRKKEGYISDIFLVRVIIHSLILLVKRDDY